MTASRQMSFRAEELRLLKAAVGELPFRRVFALMARLEALEETSAIVFAMGAKDLSLCLEALGERPYVQVRGLVASIRGQLHADADSPLEALP